MTQTGRYISKALTIIIVAMICFTSAVLADDTTVIATSTNGDRDTGNSPSLVFTSHDVGFKFALVSNQIRYYRTTDAGITWTDGGSIGVEAYQGGPVVWYDKWTPGDTGSRLNLTTINQSGYNYDPMHLVYNISGSSVVYESNMSLAQHNVSGANRTTVTKTSGGIVHSSYMKDPYYDSNENGESWRIWSCKNNCAAPITRSITKLDNANFRTGDDILIRPLGTNKAIAFIWDISVHKIYYSLYTPPTTATTYGTWTANTFLADAIDSTAYRSAWAAVTNKTTKEVYFTFNTNVDNTAGQLKTYVFNGNTATLGITPKANISAGRIYQHDIALDENSGDVYAIFTTPGSPKHFNAYISQDKMSSWQDLSTLGDFDAYVADRDYVGIGLNQSSSEIIGAALRSQGESGKNYFVKLADLVAPSVCDLPNKLTITKADTLIDNSIHKDEETQRAQSVVFISSQVGYKFDIATDERPFYRKTTNGGTTWGARVYLNSVTDCDGLVVWYDKWTPGDAASKIHITYNSDAQNRLFYIELDTNSDTISPTVPITPNGSGIDTYYLNGYSITKGYDGALYAALANYYDGRKIPMVKCSSNCTIATNWVSVAAFPSGLVNTSVAYNSEFKLVPLPNNKILALYWDDAANKITYARYDSNNTWSTAATLEASATNSNKYRDAWGVTVNHNTKEAYLCYNNNPDNVAGSIKTAIFTDTGLKTGSLRTVITGEHGRCALSFNQHTGETILARLQFLTTNLARVVAAQSRDGMQTWSTWKQVNLVNRDYETFGMNISSDTRIYTWYADDSASTSLDVLYGNTILNIDTSRDRIFQNQSVGDWLHFF